MNVCFEEEFIVIDKLRLFLMCGEIHYFRMPKNSWHDILLKARRAGLNCVSSYIPWNWHEVSENNVIFSDYSVAESPYLSCIFSRDLEAYIKLVKKLGLFFIARPGPYICSEWDSGGHPNRLYTRTTRLRSLDKAYIEEIEKWYKLILPIIAKYTIPKGGPIVMLQIENEYFWGDVSYIEKLYTIAREHVRDIPIVTNEDWYVEGTEITNTIDDYPIPWEIKNFDNKIKNYVKTQPGKLKMFMELEGGWFTHFGSPYPTSRGSFPPEWTEVLLKTAIGLGINAMNIYMFYGGTNPGYFTGKYITSSYDFEAPIREWGEISKRYYTVKRIALLTKTFNNLLIRSKPVEGVVEASNKLIDVFARVSDDGSAIIVLRNLDLVPQPTVIKYKGKVYPSDGLIRVPQRNAKIILIDYSIGGTPFKINFTSSEPLVLKTVGDETVVVLYGDLLEVGETVIESEEHIDILMQQNVIVQIQNSTKCILRYTISNEDIIAVLRSKNHTLYLIIVSRDRAERTWYIDDVDPPIIMVSNIYFVGDVIQNEKEYMLKLELDKNSCGDVVLMMFKPILRVSVDGEDIGLENIYGKLYRLYLDKCRYSGKQLIEVESEWKTKVETLPDEGVTVHAKEPLELIGFFHNGYYVYQIEFNITKDELSRLRNNIMYVSMFNDYATVILNDVVLGSGYHSLELCAVSLKEGTNRLKMILESTGHTNDGLIYVPNGVIGDIYIGKIDEKVLSDWRYLKVSTPYGRDFSMTELLNSPSRILEILNNITEEVSMGELRNSLYEQGLYITKVSIQSKDYRYILDLGKTAYLSTHFYYPRALIFINKKFVGVYRGAIDISRYLIEGINEIAIYVDWTRMCLQPVLKIYQYAISGLWKVKQFTEGIERKWYAENIDDSSWSSILLPSVIKSATGGLIWLRGIVNIDLDDNLEIPLKLVLDIRKARALVYFNGHLIGRYAEEGPQYEFYIPKPIIKKGINTIAIALHTVKGEACVNRISIEPYYIHSKHILRVYLA